MKENVKFLSEQIITYIGNKRVLLPYIDNEIKLVKKSLNKDKIVCADIFSGSGIVARLLKQHSSLLITNDLEKYSEIINSCYLSNKNDFDEIRYLECYDFVENFVKNYNSKGIISMNYAPNDDLDIKEGERVFFTRNNAKIIDAYRDAICHLDEEMVKYFLAPLLYEVSVHNNTGGVFKGFYKGRDGKGKFGGEGQNALFRILGKIELKKPVFSNFICENQIFTVDANLLHNHIKNVDITYIDPPYNQHPYGSNYFMLNVVANNRIDGKLSNVSGIPDNWNRSNYNKKRQALDAFYNLIDKLDTKYCVISYNSEGYISFNEMKDMLEIFGDVVIKEIQYNAYRASRNLNNRNIYVHEYLFTLKRK